MGDLVYGVDFRNKKRFTPVKAPIDTQLGIIAKGLSLDCPPEVLLTIYESSLGYLSPDKEPA